MLKQVQIIEKSSGQVKAQFSLNMADDTLNKDDCIIDAWNKAKDNGVVNEEKQDNYKIEFIEETSDG